MKNILPLVALLGASAQAQDITFPPQDSVEIAYTAALAPIEVEVTPFVRTTDLLDKVQETLLYGTSRPYAPELEFMLNQPSILEVGFYNAGKFLSEDSFFQQELHRLQTGYYTNIGDAIRANEAQDDLFRYTIQSLWDEVEDEGQYLWRENEALIRGERSLVNWWERNTEGFLGVTVDTPNEPEVKGVGEWDLDGSIRIRPNSLGFRIRGLLEDQEMFRYDFRIKTNGRIQNRLQFRNIQQTDMTPYIGVDYELDSQDIDYYIGIGLPIEIGHARGHIGVRAGYREFTPTDDNSSRQDLMLGTERRRRPDAYVQGGLFLEY